ncbi:hypothetical protein SDC9_131667 [bioreactor metagenome]|uniref:Uncharacterized protein n=1 Tax=bioreactor metagenome TaxID=1076179 RepID=A0A645D5K0_9ZZZZ
MVHIDIFGEAARTCNNDICFFFNSYALNLHNIFSTFQPCIIPVTSYNTRKFTFGIHNGVNEETWVNHFCYFAHIFMQRIILQFRTSTLKAGTCTNFVSQSQRVVLLNCYVTGNSRHNALASAAKTSHQMYGNAASQNNFVSIEYSLIYISRSAAFGSTKINKIIFICRKMLVNLNSINNFLTAYCNIFFMCMSTMRSLSYYDENILIRYAGKI